ncbi:phosphatase, partial [Streptomyces sp. SID7982]|nr:phosphatase [Streptomyces sp. SID7982]
PGGRREICRPDLAADRSTDPRHREVAARLGCAASYAAALETRGEGRFGAVVWLYDEPAEPDERRRHLTRLYLRQAG